MSDNVETFDIKSIQDPSFVKDLNQKQLKALCESIRKEILDKVSEYGGHLSSNLGVVELTVALHRSFNPPKDKFIFDVGHQCYTHKILTGRSLDHLNEAGYCAGFQKIAESIYDPYEAGHSSNSISAAEAFALARDKNGENYDVVAIIGDSSLVNGLAFEALNDLAGRESKVIIVLNDNDMSISPSVGGLGKFLHEFTSKKGYANFKSKFSKWMNKNAVGRLFFRLFQKFKNWIKRHLMPMTVFDNIGINYLGPVDGHNIKAMEKAFKKAKASADSVVVHVRTTKGKGYEPAENDKIGYWHGVTPFDIASGKPKKTHPGQISYSHFFSDYTDEVMDRVKNTFLIVPATLRGSGLEEPYFHHQDRAIDVGIAEEHALTMAGALSLNGYHPIVSIYSTFLQRAYDELSHDCARLNVNMTLLIDRAGLVGKNGDTHQGIYDVAFLKSIPNVVVTMPANKQMAAYLYEESLKGRGVFAIRFPRELVDEKEEINPLDLPYLSYRCYKESAKKELAIVAAGPAGEEVNRLCRDLDLSLFDPVYLSPISPALVDALLPYKQILIYDAYSIKEGFADSLLVALSLKGYKGKITCKAIEKEFVASDSLQKQRERYSLNPEDVFEAAKKLL